MPPVSTEVERKSSICSIVHIARDLAGTILLLAGLTPSAGLNSGNGADRAFRLATRAARQDGALATKALPKTRCAAQAEYGRLAAQAYSPSDAMSQAGIGLDGIQKVQCRSRRDALIPDAAGEAGAAAPAFGAAPAAAPAPAAVPVPARG